MFPLKFEDVSTEELEDTKLKKEEKVELVLLGLTYVSISHKQCLENDI